MAQLASSTARVVLNITSSTPSEGWPNFGSVMHDVWTGKSTGLGTELGAAAGILPPFHGTDIPDGGGVKQNVAMFTFDRYSQQYGWGKYPTGQSGGRPVYAEGYFAYITDHIVEHVPDVDTREVGIAVETYYLNRASHHHQSFGGSYGKLSVIYRTKDAPNTNKTIDYGQVIRFGKAWRTSGHLLQNPVNYVSKKITHAQPIVYVKIVFKMYHGMGNWHQSGDRSPSSWSPALPVCTDLHPVGISSNYWRSISNTRRGNGCVVDTATIYYRPTADQLNPPRKIIEPDKVLAGNGSWSRVGSYLLPYWNGSAPA